MKKTILQIPKPAANEKGMVLVLALLLISILALLGSTAVMTTTTDIKISANYKTSNQAFYAAEAGIEEARARMRANFTPATGATGRIDDASPTSATWSVSIGGAGPYTSIQSALSYTVSIVHQKNIASQILYWGDVNGDGINERTTSPTGATGMANKNIYLVTSNGVSANANKTVAVEMTRLPPITVPGPLYVEAATTIQGTSTNIIGVDQCGGVSTPGVVTTLAASTVTNTGNPMVCGTTHPTCNVAGTWDIVGGATNMNVQAMIDAQRDGANFIYNVNNETHTGMSWGTPTMGATLQNPSSCAVNNIVHYNTNGTAIRLAGGSEGCGILLVEGNLELSGSFSWYGVIIVSGRLVMTGGGNKNITGGVIVGGSADADLVGGNANLVYCSSAISNLSQSQPLRRLSWKEQNI